MATLTQLYTRIVLDLDRDDMGSGGALEQAKVDAVAAAVEHHCDDSFWFNRAGGTAATVAGTATVAMPSGVRFPHTVTWLGSPLSKVPLHLIHEAVNVSDPATGVPSSWAEDEGVIRLHPTPAAAYTLGIYGLASTGVPTAGGDANIWTTEAYELIVAANRILCRRLRDADGLSIWGQAEEEALAKLRRETRRRGEAPLRTDLPAMG
ncbi:MAG: phage adaptor protein [Sphingosinicella sp.]